MMSSTYTYRILRITIGIAMLFALCKCSKHEALKTISDEDSHRLSLIYNVIDEDVHKAEIYIDTLLIKATTTDNVLLKAELYLRKGVLLTKKGEFNNALDTLVSGVNLIKDIKGLPLKNLFLLRIGNVYALADKSDIAMSYYTKVYEDASAKNTKKELILSSINMAKLMRNAERYEKALEMYKVAYKQTAQIDMKESNVARILMGIGGTYLKLHQPDSAIYYSEKGYKISKSINDKTGESFFHHDFGVAYYLKKEYSKGLQYLDSARIYIEAIKNDERLSETLFNTGRCYYKLQQYKTAISYFDEVTSIINQAEKLDSKGFNPIYLEDMYDLLSKCHLASENYTKSSFYETKRNELSRIKNKKNNEIAKALHDSELNINNEFIKTVLVTNEQTLSKYKGILTIIILLCLASIYLLFHYRSEAKKNKGIFEKLIQNQEKVANEINQKSKEIIIKDTKVEEVLKRLNKIETQEYFLESSCSLANMAKKTKTNTTYLTQILKQYKEKTFYQYLNDLRINYTINRLKTDTQFQKYTIKHIALEVGYKSPESFTKHFKKATGIYPSYYIRELEKHAKTNA